jgi:hypothetical protein
MERGQDGGGLVGRFERGHVATDKEVTEKHYG